jgi:hypothetical protein
MCDCKLAMGAGHNFLAARSRGAPSGGEGGQYLASFSFPLPLMVVQSVAMSLAVQFYVLALRHGGLSLLPCRVCRQQPNATSAWRRWSALRLRRGGGGALRRVSGQLRCLINKCSCSAHRCPLRRHIEYLRFQAQTDPSRPVHHCHCADVMLCRARRISIAVVRTALV